MISLSNNPNGTPISYSFNSSLIKNSANSGFVLNGSNSSAIIQNEDPKFQNYFTQKMNLRVKADSPAKGKGIDANGITATDIVGIARGTQPTIGAYQ